MNIIHSKSRRANAPVLFATLAVLALVATTAAPASGELFTIELNNGKSFLSRYQPQRAEWDPSVILVLTDVGNWISLSESSIADVTAETEVKGFGKVISSTTIELGFAPNDAADPNAPAKLDDPVAEALRLLSGQGGSGSTPPLDDYSVQQFAEPGNATGIPASVIGSGLGTPISSEPIEPN